MTHVRACIVFLACCILPVSAQTVKSQTSVYSVAALTAYSLINDNSTFDNEKASGGFVAGAFHNFPIQSRLTAGIDLRASYSPGSSGGNFEAIALRIGFVPHHVRLRPFFQIGGGLISTPRTTTTITSSPRGSTVVLQTNRVTNGAVEVAFGLDVRLTDSLDLRVPDWGAVAGVSNSNAAGVGSFGAGLVYHLHGSRQTR